MRSASEGLKRVTLELGGSDPAIVCADADLDVAAKCIAIGRFFNAGQACLAVKRVFVDARVADELTEKLVSRAKRLKLGRGMDPQAQMGPMHSADGRATIEAQLADAVERGGRVLAGGKRPDGEAFASGTFFEPTIVADVPEDARVWTEETFGPLLPIAVVQDLDEALQRANASEFGLGSSIFTSSLATAQRAIEELQAGYTWVNAVADCPRRIAVRGGEAERLRQGARYRGAGLLHGAEVGGDGRRLREAHDGNAAVRYAAVSAAELGIPETFNVATYLVDRNVAEGRGGRTAIECGDVAVSYLELFQQVNRAGNALRDTLGVRPEERVLLLLLDTAEFAYAFLARSRSARSRSRPTRCSSRPTISTCSTTRGRGSPLSARRCCRRFRRSRRWICATCARIVVVGEAPAGMRLFADLIAGRSDRWKRSRPAATTRRSGCTPAAVPAFRRAASTCTTTWWFAPSCTRRASSA